MVKQDTIKETSKLNKRGKICTSQITLYLKALTRMSVLQISFLVLSVTFDIKKRATLELSPTDVVREVLSEKYVDAYPSKTLSNI